MNCVVSGCLAGCPRARRGRAGRGGGGIIPARNSSGGTTASWSEGRNEEVELQAISPSKFLILSF